MEERLTSEERRASLADIAFGGLSAAVIVLLLQQAQDFAPRAQIFPVAVLWVLLVASVLIVGTGALRLWRAGIGPISLGEGVSRLVAASVLIAIGGALLTWFGFYITSVVMILAIFILHHALAMQRWPSGRLLATGFVYAVVATGVMYLIFSMLIGLPAPSGTMF